MAEIAVSGGSTKYYARSLDAYVTYIFGFLVLINWQNFLHCLNLDFVCRILRKCKKILSKFYYRTECGKAEALRFLLTIC